MFPIVFFRSFFLNWVVALVLAVAVSTQAQSTEVFRLGVAPHTSARVILEMYQPLRLYLESALGQSVDVVTAPDFTEFATRMLHQDYDLAITTGHQARLAQTDAHYKPLLTYSADFRAVGLVASNSTIQKASDLKGQPVLGLSPTSLVTLWGQHWLMSNGLNQTLRYVSASDSVAHLVLEGQAALGFTSMANYQSLPRPVQSQLRILTISAPLVGRVYVLNQRHAPRSQAIETALSDFAKTEPAQAYFAKYKLDGYRHLRHGELEAMEPFAAAVRQTLK